MICNVLIVVVIYDVLIIVNVFFLNAYHFKFIFERRKIKRFTICNPSCNDVIYIIFIPKGFQRIQQRQQWRKIWEPQWTQLVPEADSNSCPPIIKEKLVI